MIFLEVIEAWCYGVPLNDISNITLITSNYRLLWPISCVSVPYYFPLDSPSSESR